MQPGPLTSSSVTVSPRVMDRRSRLSPVGEALEARRLWREVHRENLMVKVPGTRAGLPAIRTLIGLAPVVTDPV